MSRILIAEDEPHLRTGIVATLKTDGYDVIATENGAEALETIIRMKSFEAPFDLLICDYQMPKMTGEELLVRLKEFRASLPTLVMTGFGERELLVRLMRAGCRDFIDKPFEPDSLCKQVAAMLADFADISLAVKRREYLAAIGEKTLQTAHDLNNIIGGTLGYADRALEELEPGHPARSRIEKLLATSGRAAEICKNLLNRHHAAEKSFCIITEINTLIARIGAVLEDIAPEKVGVATVSLNCPVWLKADAERIQQALLNLGFNAFSAMRNGGTLTISVSEDVASRPGSSGQEKPCVVLTVRDTGCGLPSEKKEQLFEEFFSTRLGGFGLGLGIVKKIVEEEHGGWIVVESVMGKGTMFRLFFPKEEE